MDEDTDDEDLGRHGHDDADYLIALSEVIFTIPATYGVDQGDYDRLREIAHKLKPVVWQYRVKGGWQFVFEEHIADLKRDGFETRALYATGADESDPAAWQTRVSSGWSGIFSHTATDAAAKGPEYRPLYTRED